MGCNCGGSAASQQQAYEVIVNGKVDKEFSSKPEADIYATMHNGRVIAKKR